MAFYNEQQQQQQLLFETGSFTGFRPLRELGANYFTLSSFKQPLCGNPEGWGPLSPHRYDFTPCFIDVWIASVSVFGLLFGSLAVWWLLTKKSKQDGQTKNAHFYLKQVNTTATIILHRNRSIELTHHSSPFSQSSSSTSLLNSLYRSSSCLMFGTATSEF
jgi:hypothetical protein